MKLTESQKIVLLQILFDTLKVCDEADEIFCMNRYGRCDLYNIILNQQDEKEKNPCRPQ